VEGPFQAVGLPRFKLAFASSFMLQEHPMTKKDLIENVRSNSNLQRKEAEEIVESFLDIIKETLASGEEVKISGFGKFIVHQKHDRLGRNPQTGESLTITARKILTFKPSILLKQ
jgi:integration host factor subunit alpha